MTLSTRMSMPLAEPAWDIARLFPDQGSWDEEDYLGLETNHLVEFSYGCIEVLPVPTISHQRIVAFLYNALLAFVTARNLGEVLFAPVRVRLRKGKFREPDVVFMSSRHAERIGERFWNGADLVMEVVSDDAQSRHRDLDVKRVEYARAGIAEYWTVDPEEHTITVRRLSGSRYIVHGEHGAGDVAVSALVSGFSVEVAAVFRAARRRRSRGG